MSVYVDNMNAPFGRMVMCHLWADTHDELLAMVDRIGVQRKWLQQPPKASWVHFDIALSKKALAIKAGAIETDRLGPLEYEARADLASSEPWRIERGTRRMARISEYRARPPPTPHVHGAESVELYTS